MCCEISLTDVKNYALTAGNFLFHGPAGYFNGHAINYLNQYFNPGKIIIGKPMVPLINPWVSGGCSLIFAAVDFLAKAVFDKFLGEELSEKPLVQTLRMGGSIALSALIASTVFNVTFTMAAVAIATTAVATGVIMWGVQVYNLSIHPSPIYPRRF
jgi:hypothetical protein